MNEIGERVAAIGAKFDTFEKYQHDKWHELDNKLQPVVMLPEKLVREIGKLQGIVDGKIGTLTRDLEKAIEKALEPINRELSELRSDVDALKAAKAQMSGARAFCVWLAQTIIATVSTIFAVLAFGRQG